MKKIILDTNFLLIPSQLGIDIFSQISEVVPYPHQLCIVDKTVDELHSIVSRQKGKHRRAAQLALAFVESKDLNILRTTSTKSVDDLIVDLAATNPDVIVATQDKEVKKRIKNNLIYLKQKKYVVLREGGCY